MGRAELPVRLRPASARARRLHGTLTNRCPPRSGAPVALGTRRPRRALSAKCRASAGASAHSSQCTQQLAPGPLPVHRRGSSFALCADCAAGPSRSSGGKPFKASPFKASPGRMKPVIAKCAQKHALISLRKKQEPVNTFRKLKVCGCREVPWGARAAFAPKFPPAAHGPSFARCADAVADDRALVGGCLLVLRGGCGGYARSPGKSVHTARGIFPCASGKPDQRLNS